MDKVSESLMHYYAYAVREDGIQRDGVRVVPLICKGWTVKGDSATNQTLKALIAELGKTPNKFVPLVTHAQTMYKTELDGLRASFQRKLDDIVGLDDMTSSGMRAAWAKCNEACLALSDGRPAPLYDAIFASHVLDVHLSEGDPIPAFEAQENLRKLISTALHLKDCLVINIKSRQKCSLGETFARELHLRPEHSQVLSMTESAIQQWSDQGLKSEFHIFGIQENGAPPEWKIVIAADINYPFEVAKVHILEPAAPARVAEGRPIAGFEKYAAIATELYTEKKLFGETVDLSLVWDGGAESVAG